MNQLRKSPVSLPPVEGSWTTAAFPHMALVVQLGMALYADATGRYTLVW